MSSVVEFTHNSVIKVHPVGSENLRDSEKTSVKQGYQLDCSLVDPDRNQHVRLELVEPISMDSGGSQNIVFAYRPHVKLPGDLDPGNKPNYGFDADFRIPMAYRTQRDNELFAGCRPGSVQCNLTACTMVADKLLSEYTGKSLADRSEENGFYRDEPESYYGSILERFGDTTDHSAHTSALTELGIESYFSYRLSIPKLRKLILEYQLPVVIGVAFGGSGHMIVANGVYNGGIYAHDPYGCRIGCTDCYDPIGGDYDKYSNESLQAIWVDLGSDAGWGRVVTKVNGKPTGAPSNW